MIAPDPLEALPLTSLAAATGGENMLVLVRQPGDESLDAGGLIAEACRRGRPPFVMVLHDGCTSRPWPDAFPPERAAALRERETREAVHRLGLRPDRLLMAGLFDGLTPESGPVFEAVVRAVTLVMWARDCNLILAPWPEDISCRAAHRIAAEVVDRTGVGHLCLAGPAGPPPDVEGWRIAIPTGVKRHAIAAHASQFGGLVEDDPAPRIDPARLAAATRPFEALLRPPP
jgi:LmbE family N-acetylglucosaminyl deacetylase